MGTALWLVAGLAAFAVSRLLRPGRTARWGVELAASLLPALGAGVIATALDFGGWNETDWRAALFAFFAGLTGAGLARLAAR